MAPTMIPLVCGGNSSRLYPSWVARLREPRGRPAGFPLWPDRGPLTLAKRASTSEVDPKVDHEKAGDFGPVHVIPFVGFESARDTPWLGPKPPEDSIVALGCAMQATPRLRSGCC